jgi:hypothetical protein
MIRGSVSKGKTRKEFTFLLCLYEKIKYVECLLTFRMFKYYLTSSDLKGYRLKWVNL